MPLEHGFVICKVTTFFFLFNFALKNSYAIASNYLGREENLPQSSQNDVINSKIN